MRIAAPKQVSRSEFSVIPLANIVFLLLIFFIWFGRITSAGPLAIELPHSAGGQSSTGDGTRILLAGDGRIAMHGRVVSPSELHEMISQALANNPSTKIRLETDANANARQMIEVIEILRRSGVERLSLLTVQRQLP